MFKEGVKVNELLKHHDFYVLNNETCSNTSIITMSKVSHEQQLMLENHLLKCKNLNYELVSQPLQINTITIHMKTCIKQIDIVQLYNVLKTDSKNFNYTRTIGLCTQIKNSKKQFSNCIIFNCKDEGKTIALKAFTNGGFHITGTHNLVHAFRIAHKHARFIIHVLQLNSERKELIESIKIHMINSSFKISKTIDLEELTKNLIENQVNKNVYSVTFEKNDHPAVNIKILNNEKTSKATALIFRTGSIILTGVVSLVDLTHYYSIINDILSSLCFVLKDHLNAENHNEPKKRGRKTKEQNETFYASILL